MDKLKNNSAIFISLAIVLFALGFVYSAYNFSKQGTYVEVKGLSERIVKADTATWSMTFEVKANTVEGLYKEIDKNKKVVEDFLTENGIDKKELNANIQNIWQDTYKEALYRYNAMVQMSLYTKNVDAVKEASKNTLPLLEKGVIINQSYAHFEFSDINSIKPEMLAEAIANAKASASEFAKSSGASVGGISRGNQGVIDVSDKDPGSPEYKKIRVVSTLRFMLK